MRNTRGVEIKRGHYVYLSMPSGAYEGRVLSVNARDKVLTLDDGYQYPADAVTQTLGPMVIEEDGTVKQNPLTRVKVGSKSQRTKTSPTKRLRKRRTVTAKAPAGFYGNPLVRVKVGSPSQLTGEAPSARLKKRRKATAKTKTPGVYANPRKAPGGPGGRVHEFMVLAQKPRDKRHKLVASFPLREFALGYARALHNAHPGWSVKVET